MLRVIDTLYEKMNELHKSPSLIVNDGFIMSIFDEYLLELLPFEEYWKVTFEKRQMSVVARSRKDGTKMVHMALLRKELYSPTTPTNIKMRDMCVCVCVCVFLSSSRGGLPSDAVLTARQIHPPPRLQCHSPVSHPISLPLGRC